MTVRSQGFEWWRRLVDSREIPLFRRVEKVELTGAVCDHNHLHQLASFKNLQVLSLNQTSITAAELDAWRQEHPRVIVIVDKKRS